MLSFSPAHAATLAAFTVVAQALVSNDNPRIQLSARQAAIQYRGTAKGCFSSPPSGLQSLGSYTYQSSGYCGKKCTEMGFPVMALQESDCLCGDRLPPSSSSASAALCSSDCPGYPEPCGGPRAYTVWLTGVPGNVAALGNADHKDGSSVSTTASSTQTTTKSTHSSSPSSHHHSHSKSPEKHTSHTTHTSTPKTYTITQKQTTVVKTVQGPPTDGANSQSDSSPRVSSSSPASSTTIAIAIGVIAGVVVLSVIIVLLLFYLRRRRRMKNAENGHKRADSLNAFVASGGHGPSSIVDRVPPTNGNDNRLEPGIMRETRRESVGSFLADNQDYSRRILKVTNPDGT